MYAAVFSEDAKVTALLLDAGADVTARDSLGRTALTLAARSNENPDVTRLLIRAGADVDERCRFIRPSLQYFGGTPLTYAALANRNPEVTRVLLDAGADVEAADHYGGTPLMRAARYNQSVEVVKLLLDAGADVNAVNSDGATALMSAAANNENPDVTQLLVDAGANVNASAGLTSHTALIGAATSNRNHRIIEILIAAGARVDHDGDGTALQHAARATRNPKVIEALLDGGADVTAGRSWRETILEIAQANDSLRGSTAYQRLEDEYNRRMQHAVSEPALEVVLVPSGTFEMGSSRDGRDNERPVRAVTLGSFYLMVTPVTMDRFDAFARATGRDLPADRGWGRGERPVINVTWYDAVTYANWLSEQDGLAPAYCITESGVTWNLAADGWRLPTEAEWEYAARGGPDSAGTRHAGGGPYQVSNVAWFDSNSDGRTQPVGGKNANELGLYDMSGNVWEWCWDWYDSYVRTAEIDPTGPRTGTHRVARGGSFHHPAERTTVSYREMGEPASSFPTVGFRLARSVEPGRRGMQPFEHTVIRIEGGEFLMGNESATRGNETPVRRVTLDPFYMHNTVVTVAQYREFADQTGWRFPELPGCATDRHPVVNVTWLDATVYANWLSERDGLRPVYFVDGREVKWDREADGWRFPTEAEWEYAARGGPAAGGTRYAGNDHADLVAWHQRNSGGGAQQVGLLLPNELGLYDMSGNVSEWCWDRYGEYPEDAEINPSGSEDGSLRVNRGGPWFFSHFASTVTSRGYDGPSFVRDRIGFRLVRSAGTSETSGAE